MALRDTILLVSSPQGMDSVRLKKKMLKYQGAIVIIIHVIYLHSFNQIPMVYIVL
jgi:hypothetical protein